MSDDEDWFERALREEDGGEDEQADIGGEDADPESGNTEAESGNTETDGEDADETDFEEKEGVNFDETEATGFEDADDFGMGDSTPEESDVGDNSSADGFADADPYDADEQRPSGNRAQSDDTDDESSSSNRSRPDDAGNADDEGENLFGEDFATAFENAPGGGPGGSGGGGTGAGGGAGAGEAEQGGGFDGGGSGFDAGGGGFDSGGGGGFDSDGGGGFGMDPSEQGGFGDSGDTFADEEFESNIPRIDVGIEGLDDMIQGGVPERSLMTTIGSAGTGKTTFGLQFLYEALEQGENAVFITLEESHDRIVSTATEKGWDFDEYEEEGSLAVIDLDPIEMANSLTSIRNDLPRLIEEFGATRLVLDSVSLLEMMYDNQATRRNEVYDFTKSLKEAGVTTMLTSEASEDTPYASRHGIIEYLVDAVFVLRYIRSSDDFRETRLAVEIQKIRDANHSREIKPYSITNEGISVYRQANIF